jgi:hypothetical protein
MNKATTPDPKETERKLKLSFGLFESAFKIKKQELRTILPTSK